jgi:hypothetical protein
MVAGCFCQACLLHEQRDGGISSQFSSAPFKYLIDLQCAQIGSERRTRHDIPERACLHLTPHVLVYGSRGRLANLTQSAAFLAETRDCLLSSSPMAMEDDILATLSRKPGLKGREIASQLGLDKGLVNSTLSKLRLRKLTWQDGGYRWFLKTASTESSRQTVQPQLETPLTQLCRYYLHCLSLDDEGGVCLFAQSRFSPEYIELPVLPEFDPKERSISSFAGVSELFHRLRNSASRQVPYLGYPVRLRPHRSEKGWEGFFIEPVFLFEFTDESIQRGAEPALTGELPTFNVRVLKSLAMGDDSQIMDEAARLAEELGFSEAEPPELDEFIARLVEIREDWDWKEAINPTALSSGTPLGQIKDGGIYNQAIVFGCERSPYTKGLEQELAELQKKTEEA